MVALSPAALAAFAIVLLTLVLFVAEPVPVDITAIGVMVLLMLLEPVTGLLAEVGLLAGAIPGLDPEQGLSGFASGATITVLAMFVLSDGVQRTGVVHMLGRAIAVYTGDSESRQLGATVGLVAPISGIVNNTAAVAILLPMVSDLAHEGGTSPSKLLLPLSYASMFGGTLTLIGTSTNILASEFAARPRFLGRSLGMFEFTALGVLVTVVGTIYLMTVGRWLIPERIEPKEDLTAEFEMTEYLTEVRVAANSPLAGQTVRGALEALDVDLDVIQLIRDGEVFPGAVGQKALRAGDVLAVRVGRQGIVELLDVEGLEPVATPVDDAELERADEPTNLVEVVVAPGSSLVGDSLVEARFRGRYDATVLALRRGGAFVRERLDHVPLRVGDTLLVQADADSIERLDANRDFIVAQQLERREFRTDRIPVAVGIVLGVVGVAALGFVSIVVAALAGALAMVFTGCLRPPEVYEAVHWDVIFLLAGIIPLGVYMEESDAADVVADAVVASSVVLPAVGVLALFYVVTALLTNVISNNASVVLMLPVAFEAADAIGADPLPFLFAVMFAASTAFMTPVGYQTNLFVYGPGGYRFSDYLRVGTPLQVLLAVVTTAGIAVMWPP